MPIDQSKLDALKSLATGGSAGLDAYKQAQGAEQASRTDALKGALGGQDVYNAATKAQGQFAPNVGTSAFADSSNLAPAANQFLSQQASKLADEKYKAQESLLFDTAKLNQANAAKSQKDLLQGAADVYGESQRQALNPQALTDMANQRTTIQQNLAALEQTRGLDPDFEAKRNALMDQQAQTDARYAQLSQGFAGQLGLDTKGLQETYASGDAGKVRDLVNYLTPQAEQRGRQIDVEGQKRLRELAPAFGMSELEAQGTFREGEGNDLNRVGSQQKQAGYVAGETTPKEQNAAEADALGFEDPGTYKSLKNATKLKGQDIQGVMQSDNWGEIGDFVSQYAANGGEGENTGVKGFRAALQNRVKAATHPDGTPLSDKEKQNLINLSTAYYNPMISRSFGTGATEEG